MSCPFLHEQTIIATSIKPSIRADPIIGQRICFYDQIFVWTDEHVPPSALNQWRKQGDHLIDQFFQKYGEQFQDNDDTYEWLEHFLVENPLDSSFLIEFEQYIRQRPSWFDPEQIRQGQRFFLKNLSLMLTSIFHYTLLMGYGFQQLNDVLNKTNYLSSNDLSLSHRRLVETLQMIATTICGDLDQFDQTFSDVLRVRLLHGMVRYKILKEQRSNRLDDIPINQEDSLITLLGFSFSLLFCIEERFHIALADDDKQAYLHLWRYIGWLMGIDDQYLVYLSSFRLTRTISESIFYHFYLPSHTSKHMVHHALMSSYLHGKLPLSYRFYLGISQILLGEHLSHVLQIDQPKIDRLHFYTIRFLFQTFRLIHWLGSLNSRRFDRWLIERSKQRLNYLVYTGLNYQLKNFALFKSDRLSASNAKGVPLKDCSCQFYQKKDHSMIKTYDIGIFRRREPWSFVPFLQQSMFVLLVYIIIRYWTVLNM